MPQAPAGLRRVLIRLPNWLGDVVMAGPAVAAIHRARPDAQLIAQVKAPFMPLARLLPGVVEAIPAGRDKSPRDYFASRRRLKALALDGAVCFPRSTRAGVAPWLAGIPVRIGYTKARKSRLFTHAVRGWSAYRSKHRSEWFGLLAKAFGVQPDLPLELAAPEEGVERARRILINLGRRHDRPLVVLEPGASYGAAKCWPAERFGQLAQRLRETLDVDVATVGTEATKPIERIVAAHAPHLIRTAGRTGDLTHLLGLLAEADLVISNDTGPMHVAGALGRPVLALFGASDPVVSSPIGGAEQRILYDPEPCSPCFLRTCPLEGHPCLSKIGVERVLRHATTLLR